MKPLDQCRLYTFIDTAYLRGRDPVEAARQLCRGGSDLIQLRAKDSAPGEIRQMAAAIGSVLREAGVGFVVNDYYDIARETGADLCHLGQEDFFGAGHAQSAEFSGPGLGLSTHAPEQGLRAAAAKPAYIAIGPVYATGTKPGAKPVGLDYVRWAARYVTIPWFAIGGIGLGNIGQVIDAGAARICAVSAILNAPDIAEACREFKKRLPP
ncbi:MAG TPA: thiamine phosphate synthase [Verrucomicrobiae bacterium]|jgi:thiamine-phosphate pyrophosphorylase